MRAWSYLLRRVPWVAFGAALGAAGVWSLGKRDGPAAPTGPAVPAAEREGKVSRERAVKIALAHLGIEKVREEPSDAFNLRVSKFAMTRKDAEEPDDDRFGRTKHKDLSGLPDSFQVYCVEVQHWPCRESAVYVTKEGGRVILVKEL